MTSALKAKRQLSPALREFKGYIKYWDLCLMLLPVIAYFIIFKYIPMGGIVIAFKDFKLGLGVSGSEWVGLANFVDAFRTRFFIRAIRNTLIISVLKLCVGFPAPIILALLLNEVRHSGYKRVIQTISYLPHFLSWIIMAGILSQLLSPNNGAVNGLLKSLGRKDPVPFLLDNTYFRGTVVISDVWKGVGWGSILYLAAISSIDPTLYEAAICDGATRPQRVRYITIPCILPTITIMLILSLGGILDAGFDQLLNLYSSAVYETGDIIDTYVYRVGLVDWNYKLSTAIGLFKNVIGFMLVAGTNAVAKAISGIGIW
ncbi:MAG: sugar ABC transporter permease [Clostridia bacterium]|nr:sugar ABC transporter permease [Clostridia bacterium]MBR5986376.1 sugar ABC transporter permease [Clostridia bacterium]